MAKIDCSKTVNFLREYKRMCDSYEHCCQCAFNEPVRSEGISCNMYCQEHSEIAVEIVQKWSNEHPQKTRLGDLNEKYPNYRFYENDKCPDIRPSVFGYCDNCLYCRNSKQTLRYCWDEPLNGGATGKAVE